MTINLSRARKIIAAYKVGNIPFSCIKRFAVQWYGEVSSIHYYVVMAAMFKENSFNYRAKNIRGDPKHLVAYGIIQLTNDGLSKISKTLKVDDLLDLTLEEQMTLAEKYFEVVRKRADPERLSLVSSFYCAIFLPALLEKSVTQIYIKASWRAQNPGYFKADRKYITFAEFDEFVVSHIL